MDRGPTTTKSQAYEASEDRGSNPSAGPTMGDVIAVRFDRRDLLKGILAVPAITALAAPAVLNGEARAQMLSAGSTTPSFDFREIPATASERDQVAEGYDADVLIRWGDPVLPGAPAFDPMNQTAAAQALQFGYNNDYLGYFPIGGSSEHGLLCVNHEYTNEELMFPGLGRQDTRAVAFRGMTKALVDIEMMAHGGTVVEIRKVDGKWSVVAGSRFARRITAETPMEITGPARGHARMRTSYDPTGTRVRGMLNNCAGGRTPWGTWLTCEENFNGYFWGAYAEDHPERRNNQRLGLPGRWYNWGAHHDRFDVTREPNEPNRFGWVVEIDPFDPTFVPKKRTAMGRFKHEGAAGIVNADGRYVIYQGDDERFDYVYRFVTRGRVTGNRAQDLHLLEDGELSVARYDADGTVHWLALTFGEGPLTPANGFQSQADVMIETRRAADLLGATRMDRRRTSRSIRARRRSTSCSPTTTGAPRRRSTPPTRAATTASATSSKCCRRAAITRRETSDGRCWCAAATRAWPRWAPRSIRTRARTAGSACPTTARSTRRAGSGSRPTATRPAAPGVPTGSGRSRPRVRRARRRSCSTAAPRGRSCAGRSSRPTTPRCSSRTSIRAKRRTRIRAPRPRPSRTPRRAGRISARTCRRGRPWSRSRGAAAARSADAAASAGGPSTGRRRSRARARMAW